MQISRTQLIDTLRWLAVGLLAAIYTITVAKPIILTASDLGRHLTNGRLFLDDGIIQTTNAYSYTHPDFPFLNHHWGSGVLFELARRWKGFAGVSLFGLSIVFCTAVLYMRAAWKRGTFWTMSISATLVLGTFASRAEIRPELFSYILSAIFLWILLGVRGRTMSPKALIALPLLTLAWVNLHIYFFLGVGWVGAFFLDALFRAWRDPADRELHMQDAQRLFWTLATMCAVTPLNPNGWRGAVYPLRIFQNYAYAVAENQSALRIARQSGTFAPVTHFFVVLALLWISWALRLHRSWKSRALPDIALLVYSIFASIIAWGAIRNFQVFAYVSLVALPTTWNDIAWPTVRSRWNAVWKTCLFAVVVSIIFLLSPAFWRSTVRTIGFGIAPNITQSITFFQQKGLTGPILNNYDIGGFLTYGLYPAERVFVDNRPEAYPGDFFTQELLPMQMDEQVWLRVDAKYQFHTIFFYRHDLTRWGQMFMIRRLQDPAWAPVYADDFVLLFARRIPEHENVIQEFEIPRSRFEVQPRQR